METDANKGPVGVLLMAHGGPDSLEEMPGYLASIRGGRPTNRAVLNEMLHNYRLVGGRSPLLEISRRQAAALEDRLNREGPEFKVYLGMQHWSPWIEETVRDMLADGITRGVALVLAPHYSSFSVAKYHKKVQAGLEMYGGKIEFEFINSYNTAPGYIEAMANRVREGLDRWPAGEQAGVHVILSAHSLPERAIRMGDPYQEQLFESARLIADQAGLSDDRWSWSYQSAGRSPDPWLGPQLDEQIIALAQRGVRNIVSVPIGFVSDHVEILYDIDIKAQATARENAVRLERPPALNDDPLFIGALAGLVRERAGRWLSPATGTATL
jgi:ferrochelatase